MGGPPLVCMGAIDAPPLPPIVALGCDLDHLMGTTGPSGSANLQGKLLRIGVGG
jgi:hypothetical protein